MKKIILPLLLFITCNVFSQSLKKYPVSKSGCSYYNYCDAKFDISKSHDSSDIYTAECTVADVNYGIICVKLLNPVTGLQIAEDLLIAYLDFLKQSFSITKSAGYGKGHRLNGNENTRGIIDYWQDKENYNWKVKGWTDGKFIGVLYAYTSKELPEQKVTVFLDGFRLPEMK
jgi:hypothetical protein